MSLFGYLFQLGPCRHEPVWTQCNADMMIIRFELTTLWESANVIICLLFWYVAICICVTIFLFSMKDSISMKDRITYYCWEKLTNTTNINETISTKKCYFHQYYIIQNENVENWGWGWRWGWDIVTLFGENVVLACMKN